MMRILSTALLGLVIVGCAATSGLPDENTRSTDPQSVLNKTWQWVLVFRWDKGFRFQV